MTLKRSISRMIVATLVGAFVFAAAVPEADAQLRRRGRRTIRLGTFKIEGTIQKPQAFYILQRSNLNFEGLELKNSFVPKIIKSVEKTPF